MKLQLITLAYNHGFQNKMHYIFEILRLEFTIPLLFWKLFLACIGLDYYRTNHTFNDIVISNLTNLYNIIGAWSSIQIYIFQAKSTLYFWKKNSLCAQLYFWWIQIVEVQPYNTKTNHHKCTKITCVFEQPSFISTPPSTSKIQMLKHTNKKYMILIKKNSPFTYSFHHYKLHYTNQLLK